MTDSHIFPFLWMRGEPEAVLRTEMEKIFSSGIRAVCLEARPHPDFVGEGWWHDVVVIPDKARRWLYTQFVDVTGPMPAAQVDVDLLMTKQFTWMDIGKPSEPPLYDETRLLSVTASEICDGDLTKGAPMNLTAQLKDGYLTADIPPGTWRIFVTFVTTAIGPKPDYINYIEADSARVLIDEVYEKHYARYKDV